MDDPEHVGGGDHFAVVFAGDGGGLERVEIDDEHGQEDGRGDDQGRGART